MSDRFGFDGLAFFFSPTFISSCGFGFMRTSAPIKRFVWSKFSPEGFLTMTHNPFNPRPDILPHGDKDISEIYMAVGAALVQWEWMENGFAHLFGTIVGAPRHSYSARRAYGSLISAKTRFGMLKEAGEAYFDEFPESKARAPFDRALGLYSNASDRRNDIAHGVVTGGPGNRAGYYLAANLYTSKRKIRSDSPYYYTASQIHDFSRGFEYLAHLASGARQLLSPPPKPSPKKRV